ncbi:flagellar motor protein MotB [Hahella ganghwensis]|uniref:flagellar motor protein MotB n=1 Tax=Hahella ganghwensis TaxID=286420 RepID=UPI0003828213|nr:flagellar motor protein MotB [Hahella ganghwensis]
MKRTRKSRGLIPGTSGAPSWIVTFADLMTLLLTFFILLLSFSNLDAEKYRAIAYSMSKAFGVPWAPGSQIDPDLPPVIVVDPEGTSTSDGPLANQNLPPVPPALPPSLETSSEIMARAALAENDALATKLIGRLEQQLADDEVDIRFDDKGVVLTFTERASFESGSADLKQYMRPVLIKVVDELANCEGDIIVTGHTDDRPIDSARFRSNWDLSAARAVSVVHQLVLDGRLDASRVEAVGMAETRPLLDNDTEGNRTRNRRVEIVIENAKCNFQ